MELDAYAQILWNFAQVPGEKRCVDAIIVMGSYDTTVASRAAEIYKEIKPLVVVTTGGKGRLTPQNWYNEAAEFKKILIDHDVPKDRIYIEDKSTNTSENILNTKALLEQKNIPLQSAIFVMQPCLERRTYAMFLLKWPQLDILPPYRKVKYENYVNSVVDKEEVLNLLVGEVSRYISYGEKGYMIKQEIPNKVMNAYVALRGAGYIKYIADY